MIRSTKWRALAATAAASALVLSACGSDDTDGANGGDNDCTGTIAAFGAMSGPNAVLVVPAINAAQIAVDEFNEANDCDIKLEAEDTEGSGDKAVPLATAWASRDDVVAVMGGAFSGETRATKGIFQDAGIPMVSESATADDLTQDPAAAVDVFHRVVPYDSFQAKAIVQFLKEQGAKKVFVVGNSEEYGQPLADTIAAGLGDLVVDTDKTQVGQTDFAPTVAKIKASGADHVFYGGYVAELTPLAAQIADEGLDVPVFAGDGAYGDPIPGAVVSCPCTPIEGSELGEKFRERHGDMVPAYVNEGYMAATIILEGIKEVGADREALQEFIENYEGTILGREISFDEFGDASVPKTYYFYDGTDGTAYETLGETTVEE